MVLLLIRNYFTCLAGAELFILRLPFIFSLLQVEHRTTERLTEQIERRVGSETNSLDELSVGSKESDKTEKLIHKAPTPLDAFQRPGLHVSKLGIQCYSVLVVFKFRSL